MEYGENVMSERITLNKLEQNLAFFSKMYDVVRIVDPVHKKVLEYNGCRVGKTNEICFDYWQNGNICDNCISVRAYQDNKSYMKLEQNTDVIMLVIALPIEGAEEPVVLELLKNATDSMMIGTGDYNNGHAMRNVVYDINNMVIKDHLTSTYNRRFVDDRLPVDIIKATVAEQPLSIIFLDIDNMKSINDTYGHTTGDLVLKNAADTLQNCIRTDMDWIARFGGDEFIICLNNIGSEEADHIAERIRNNIAAIKIPICNGSINVTASLGIQTMLKSPLTAEDMICMADEKMYEDKRRNQNQTRIIL